MSVFGATMSDGTVQAQTLNSTYKKSGNEITRASFLGDIPDVKNGTQGWVFSQGCIKADGTQTLDANNNVVDCFKLQIDNTQIQNQANAQLTCQALDLARRG